MTCLYVYYKVQGQIRQLPKFWRTCKSYWIIHKAKKGNCWHYFFLFFHWQRIVLGETFLCWHWGSVCICVAGLFQWINQSSSAMTKSQYFPANFQCLTWNLSVHCFKSAQKSGHGSEIWIHLALPNHHNITIQCSELGQVKISKSCLAFPPDL